MIGRARRWAGSKAARGLALISPALLYAMAMLLLPVLIIVFSFWKQTFLTVDHSLRLDNYRAALTQPIYRDLFLRSLWISLTVSVTTVMMAYPVAWEISFHGGRNKNLWLFLITVPFLTSYLLRVMSWKLVLGDNGVLNSLLLWLRGLWDGERAEHELTGRVASRAYFGETTSLSVAVAGLEAPLSIVETNNFGADALEIGAEVRLAFAPEALVRMADPDAR